MDVFNDNPFAKDTPVTPFSNGTEAQSWHQCNCDKCIKYEIPIRIRGKIKMQTGISY